MAQFGSIMVWLRASEAMRPKTFPAAPYVGNTRQRLQEIKEGLKQPAKLMSQALHGGSSRVEGSRSSDCKSNKDTGNRQQQLRPPQKFNNYQNALREIRKSLLPFANESGASSGSGHPTGAGEVNRQMLQELVNAGCDQVSENTNISLYIIIIIIIIMEFKQMQHSLFNR
uniref:Uncharacterized protein n=1 Tax=Knipowitschia caucasica TaxID=637954 RepID=A0AAV2K3D5_KNICA